jgi:hypothetical protein
MYVFSILVVFSVTISASVGVRERRENEFEIDMYSTVQNRKGKGEERNNVEKSSKHS